MRIKGITDEDFLNYKDPCLYLCTPFCDFKCELENKVSCCQNSSLAKAEIKTVDDDEIIQRYLANPITKAICFAGLEPFDSFGDMYDFIEKLRETYHCNDTVVIYTGCTEDEIEWHVDTLRPFGNIIVKFGRFIPGCEKHYDEVLGVNLASPNQYAKKIS